MGLPKLNKIAVLLALTVFTSACRGQGAAQSHVDPALVALADTLIPRLEVLSGLKKLRPVEFAEQSKQKLRGYIEQRLAEEMPPRELEGVRQTYIALGLIPDSLDMKKLLLDLYQEQVAGYYDPKTDKFYVVKGTPVSLLRPVLAHELVHALQDQHQNLDSLIARSRGNDRQSAAQAAIEGQATIVMFAVLAEEASGRPIVPAALPDISAQLRPALDAQNSQFPVFRNAPRIFRETMVFPYVGGARFVQQLWNSRSDLAFAAPLGTLLPQSTEQVLHAPERFLVTRDAPTEIRFDNKANVLYENTLGELETGIVLSEYLKLDSDSAASGWDGDRYQVLDVGGKKALVWASVWDDAGSADRFAQRYREVAAKRPNRAIRVERTKIEGREGVVIFDGARGVDVAKMQLPVVHITTR